MKQINDKVQAILDKIYSNIYEEHTFHNDATSTGNGTALTVGNKKTLTIEIYGTSSTRLIKFYSKAASGDLRPLMGINISTYEMATQTTGTGEVWQFDITGLDSVIMGITEITGGNVTIKGRAVS